MQLSILSVILVTFYASIVVLVRALIDSWKGHRNGRSAGAAPEVKPDHFHTRHRFGTNVAKVVK